MIKECKDCLKETLGKIGIKQFYTVKKREFQAFPCAIITLVVSKISKDERKVAQTRGSNLQKARKKRYHLQLPFEVYIIATNEETPDKLTEDFLMALPSRIMDKYNNTIDVIPIEIEPFEDTSFLKNNFAIMIKVTFEGGLYKDTETTLISTENTEISTEVNQNG